MHLFSAPNNQLLLLIKFSIWFSFPISVVLCQASKSIILWRHGLNIWYSFMIPCLANYSHNYNLIFNHCLLSSVRLLYSVCDSLPCSIAQKVLLSRESRSICGSLHLSLFSQISQFCSDFCPIVNSSCACSVYNHYFMVGEANIVNCNFSTYFPHIHLTLYLWTFTTRWRYDTAQSLSCVKCGLFNRNEYKIKVRFACEYLFRENKSLQITLYKNWWIKQILQKAENNLLILWIACQ